MQVVRKVEQVETFQFNFTREELVKCIKVLDDYKDESYDIGLFFEFRNLAINILSSLRG